MASIQSLVALAQDLVTALDAGTLRDGFHRRIQRGSAHGEVTVIPNPDPTEEQSLLVVRLSIMPAPRRNLEQFLATLLELNHRFMGRAGFSLDGRGMVYLTSGRRVNGLDEGEVLDLLLWTSEQADHYDDILMDAFPQ